MFPSLLLALAALPALASAHGYLSSPAPRGIQKATYAVDDLKSPNKKGLCRGEPVGQIHPVRPGQKLTLGLTITAPHTGPCQVSLLDANLRNEHVFASKYDCAAPGKADPWTVTLPSNARGRMVLRWYWQGRHVTPGENYEQCIDLDFGGGSGGPAPTYNSAGDDNTGDNAGDDQTVTASGLNDAPSTPSYDNGPASGNDNASYDDAASNDGASYSGNDGGNDGGACPDGGYECTGDGGFNQCAHGQWVKMGCAAGTRCRSAGNTVICDWA